MGKMNNDELIKAIIKEFCPRYTPGGKVIYLEGDGKKKMTKKLFILINWA